MENKDKQKKDGVDMRSLWNASTIGLAFVSSICIGSAMGFYIDQLFGTKPYATLFFMVMGIVAGFKNAFYFLKRTDLWNAKDIIDPSEETTDDKHKY